jgi:hypothetical protein
MLVSFVLKGSKMWNPIKSIDSPLGWWYLKAKIVQEYKESKVKMYKLIWGLMFKYNDNKR